jgi:hypothetical protein
VGTGIRRNSEESGANTGIPAKNPVKGSENRKFQDPPPKPRSCEEIPPKKKNRKKRNPRESWQNGFLGSKKRIPENRNRQPSVQPRDW